MQVDVHNNMGDLWRAQGAAGRHQAQRCYTTALRLDQSYAPAWRGLGDLLREEGDHAQAVACYQVHAELSGASHHGVLRSGSRLCSGYPAEPPACKGRRSCVAALVQDLSQWTWVHSR